jgi:hypothetical protein
VRYRHRAGRCLVGVLSSWNRHRSRHGTVRARGIEEGR